VDPKNLHVHALPKAHAAAKTNSEQQELLRSWSRRRYMYRYGCPNAVESGKELILTMVWVRHVRIYSSSVSESEGGPLLKQ
jgi:hypothetical protein